MLLRREGLLKVQWKRFADALAWQLDLLLTDMRLHYQRERWWARRRRAVPVLVEGESRTAESTCQAIPRARYDSAVTSSVCNPDPPGPARGRDEESAVRFAGRSLVF
jgi:hypothetical protein